MCLWQNFKHLLYECMRKLQFTSLVSYAFTSLIGKLQTRADLACKACKLVVKRLGFSRTPSPHDWLIDWMDGVRLRTWFRRGFRPLTNVCGHRCGHGLKKLSHPHSAKKRDAKAIVVGWYNTSSTYNFRHDHCDYK